MYAKRLFVTLAIAMVPRLASAAVTMTPNTLDAGNVLGDSDLVITTLPITGTQAGDFAVTAGPMLPATITASSNALFTVTYNPLVMGASSAGTLTVNSNDPATPSKAVSLTGTPTNAVIS